MKGLLFHDQDYGHGGPGGFISAHKKWCVEIDGKKVHVCSEVVGDPLFPPALGGVQRHVTVKPCDSSCKKIDEVDKQVEEIALMRIEATDRLLAPQEKENLPSELIGTTYLAELVESYRRMMNERDQKRGEANAGRDLFRSIKQSRLLRWFLRKEISRYEESI